MKEDKGHFQQTNCQSCDIYVGTWSICRTSCGRILTCRDLPLQLVKLKCN